MAVERCHGCHGRKTHIGLGGMERDCLTCRGIGFVTAVEAEPICDDVVAEPVYEPVYTETKKPSKKR